MGLGQRCPRVSLDDRGRGGAAHARHRHRSCGSHEGACRGHPGVLQRRLHVLSGGPHRCLPRRDDVCEDRQAGAPPLAPLCAPSRSGLRAIGHAEEAGQVADAQHARRAWRRTPDAPGLHDQHGLGRTGEPDRAAGLGTVGAEDVQLLERPRAPAATGGLLPGLLQCGTTAHELAAAVAAARAHTPRRDVSSLAGAHASNGGRRDGSRLDLS